MRQTVTPAHSDDRISQTVGTVTTTYILDTATPLTMVLSKTNETTHVTTRYWHGLDTLAQSNGTTTETFAYDGLGSVRQLVNETGSVRLTQTFDPYGNGYTKAGFASSSFGYTGEQVDSNGFVFLRARYYNPGQGRFFQRDTFRGSPDYPLTLNPYMYGLGNPVRYSDPNGHCPVLIGAFLGLVIGGLGSYAYANTIYHWALTGQCGCEKQDWAHRTNKERFAQDMAFYGAMFGMVMGAVAGSGGLGLGAVSLVGGGLSGYQIGNALSRMASEGITPCNYLDFSLGVIGAMMAIGGVAGAGSPTMGIPWPTSSSSISSISSSIAALSNVGAVTTVLVPSISAVGASAATAVNANVLLMASSSGSGGKQIGSDDFREVKFRPGGKVADPPKSDATYDFKYKGGDDAFAEAAHQKWPSLKFWRINQKIRMGDFLFIKNSSRGQIGLLVEAKGSGGVSSGQMHQVGDIQKLFGLKTIEKYWPTDLADFISQSGYSGE